ncbi:sodium:proton exchanger [Nonomuraea typhae]|uniref:Sodium:proton exchanger n=1 Tax=Nonomuraea typhae TaxID=2603600 RepID=A0ABW7Z4P2_9ACTN
MSGETLPVRVAIIRGLLVLALAAPALVVRLSGLSLPAPAQIAVFGAGVLAAAVVLMWASETARADISGALALALLALIAVLPEYAVDLYYAYTAASRPEYAAYTAANMTGANRLLVGVGWALVVLAFALGQKRRPAREVRLTDHHRIELGFLCLAALAAFLMPLTASISWYVSILMVALYVWYIVKIARCGGEDLEKLTGVPSRLAALPRGPRRAVTAGAFLLGALIVFASAEPFAEALVSAGATLGVDRFLLVQWLGPLASEAPELIVAVVFAWRLRDGDAMGALLSSKVNQWTLLVGTLPLAYRAGGGEWSLPLDSRQVEEVFLTASQTVLGVAMLVDLVFRRVEAALLFTLFAVQFVLPDERVRLWLSVVYLVLGVAFLVRRRRDLGLALGAVIRKYPHAD